MPERRARPPAGVRPLLRHLIDRACPTPQANVVFSSELHRRYAEQGIVSVSLHPGNLKTDLQRHISKVESALTVRVLSWNEGR